MLMKSEFSHNGRRFEVQADLADNEVRVRLFEDNQPASPVVYSVTVETAFDAKMRGFPLDLVKGLMSLVKGLMSLVEHDTTEGILQLFRPI